jgi:hypothetical protein
MGYSTDAYLAYGVRVPVNPYHYDENGRNPGEQVDQALSVPTLKEVAPDVGHLSAGAYDRDSFFLVTFCESAGYEPKFLDDVPMTEAGEASWERQLLAVLEHMGWNGLVDAWRPGWFVIASTD